MPGAHKHDSGVPLTMAKQDRYEEQVETTTTFKEGVGIKVVTLWTRDRLNELAEGTVEVEKYAKPGELTLVQGAKTLRTGLRGYWQGIPIYIPGGVPVGKIYTHSKKNVEIAELVPLQGPTDILP